MPDDASPVVRHGAPAPVAVVTGAAGWLGKNLVRDLVKSRERVRAMIRTPDEAPLLELISPKVEVVVGDVRDPVAADRLFDGVDGAAVYHAAAVIHPHQTTREFFDVNVGGTETIVDRARRRAHVPVRARVVELALRGERLTGREVHRGLALRPVHGLRPLEDGSRAARPAQQRPGRRRDRDRARAVVLRPGPARPPDAMVRSGPQGPLPAGGPRHAAPLDGVHRQPRAGADARRDRDRGGGPRLLGRGRRALRAAGDPRDGADRARRRGPRGDRRDPEAAGRRG